MVRTVRWLADSLKRVAALIPHEDETEVQHYFERWNCSHRSRQCLVMETYMDLEMALGGMSLTEAPEGHRDRPLVLLVRNEMEQCLHEHGERSVEVYLELEGLCNLESHRLVTREYSRGAVWSARWSAVPKGSLACLPGPEFLLLWTQDVSIRD